MCVLPYLSSLVAAPGVNNVTANDNEHLARVLDPGASCEGRFFRFPKRWKVSLGASNHKPGALMQTGLWRARAVLPPSSFIGDGQWHGQAAV